MGLRKYLQTMMWKVWLLFKLTLGFWDDELLENFEIKHLCEKFDINDADDDLKHEVMLQTVGEAYSLIWQFLPGCVLVAKAGEALNASPIFVFDSCNETSIQIAKSNRQDYEEHKIKFSSNIAAELAPEGKLIEVNASAKGMLVWFEDPTKTRGPEIKGLLGPLLVWIMRKLGQSEDPVDKLWITTRDGKSRGRDYYFGKLGK